MGEKTEILDFLIFLVRAVICGFILHKNDIPAILGDELLNIV